MPISLPALIAGPILRRVEATNISVWVAFSKKQIAKLVIWDDAEIETTGTEPIAENGAKATSNLMETLEIASQLHIALITLDTSQTKLESTKIYAYNIYFGDSAAALTNDLNTAKLLTAPEPDTNHFPVLGYNPGRLPTIIIAGDKLEDLHLIHGSCRKIHGNGDESFRHVDSLIKKNIAIADLSKRPQQLFLTGDQIYADEIPKLALPFINALGTQIFNDKKEQLILESNATSITKSAPADMQHFPPGGRQHIQNKLAMFTGNGTSSHLFAFPEFCATYLFYWSPEAWPKDLVLMLTEFKNSSYDDWVGSFHYYFLVNILKDLATEMVELTFPSSSEEETNKRKALIKKLHDDFATGTLPAPSEEINTLTTKWQVYSTVSGFEDVVKTMRISNGLSDEEKKTLASIYSMAGVLSESRSSVDFLLALPYARRALANISTYMIFDDHEMTDDWNFSHLWKNRVHSSPLGVQLLRNGMMAYTIFQDWGNVPVEYPYELLKGTVSGTDLETKETNYKNTFKKTKGNKLELLKKISEYGKAMAAGSEPEKPGTLANTIDTLLLVAEKTPAADSFVTPVRWHYDITTGAAHTFFLDTRTRREFDEFTAFTGLLSKEAMDDQLPERITENNYPVVFVISPVPALSLPVIEEFAQPLVGMFESGINDKGIGGAPIGALSGALKRDTEAWGFSEKHMEMFLARLATFKKVIILSGDIHFGCTTYADYWKQRKAANHARIVQLVSSPFKNGWDLDFILLKSGFAQRLIAGFDFEFEKHGWQDKDLKTKGRMAPRHRMRIRRNAAVIPRQGWPAGTTIEPEEPDWVWRLRVSVDERDYTDLNLDFPLSITTDLTEETGAATKDGMKATVLQMANRHNSLLKLGRSRRIVWQPHIGHIFFTKIGGDATKLAVNHEFHYTLRTDGFLNSDTSPDFDKDVVLAGPFTLHTINMDVTPEELAPPTTLNQVLEPNPVV